ncbi:MAG TPA: AAA family ATPase [Saprospiraceae bacterium]|nr:AAA family ATPase [Saprospiraceae bacterium]HMQ84518.1 AAA family ATPase [Saprospiraceae bacterium]
MKYPIGIQDFRKLREDNYIYVDKTQHIFNILGNGNYFFLSRPRRFGKSLLLSTINEWYGGSRDLFKGLWIEDKWDWEANMRPVIWLKFASFQYKYNPLKDAIAAGLQAEAERLEVALNLNNNKHPFAELLKKVYEKYGRKVSILIDEYDKPIIDYLDDIPQAEANRNTLKWLYSVLKDSDPYIELLFITGVSAFSKVSVFSDLNNLANISLEPSAYTLLGITQQELETVFAEQLKTTDKEKVKEWYNGYSWGGADRVYNPFSLLRFLNSGQFNNYWFETRTPTFLVKEMKKGGNYKVSNINTSQLALTNFDISRLNPITVLFQTGYLTVKAYVPEDLLYTLDYPNKEVKHALEQLLLDEYMYSPYSEALPRVVNLRNALQKKDLPEVVVIINAAFASIPYEHWQKENEHFYHALIHLMFSLLGTYIRSEVHSAKGRCDALVETADYIYAFEFKLDKPVSEAMQQIQEKGYLKPYADSPKEKIAVGMSFSTEAKEVVDWATEIFSSDRTETIGSTSPTQE